MRATSEVVFVTLWHIRRRGGWAVFALACAAAAAVAAAEPVRFIVLDPGPYLPAQLHEARPARVAPDLRVYAPPGPDVRDYYALLKAFNHRADAPTDWAPQVFTGPDYLAQVPAARPGEVALLLGRNGRRSAGLVRAVEAGYHVLGQPPLAITPEDFGRLTNACAQAAARGLRLAELKAARYDSATRLLRELAGHPALFGRLETGTPESPAVLQEASLSLRRERDGQPWPWPAWWLDVAEQGEGLVASAAPLVDLVQWTCFPDQALAWQQDVYVLGSRRWATTLTRRQFQSLSGLDEVPAELRRYLGRDGHLHIYNSGEIVYRLRGINARVAVSWSLDSAEQGGDMHYALLRGSRAALIIRQGRSQRYQPTLYVEKRCPESDEAFEALLTRELQAVAAVWPGLSARNVGTGNWEVRIPAALRVSPAAQQAQAWEAYLDALGDAPRAAQETANLLAVYYTTLLAWQMCPP